MNILKKSNFDSMSQKSTGFRRPGNGLASSWEDDSRDGINPEEEIKKAFTQMTDEQLRFHLKVGGKNKKYADTILNHRKKNE